MFCVCMQSTDSSLYQNKDLTNDTFPCHSVLSTLSHPEIAFNFSNLGYSTSIDHFSLTKYYIYSFVNCHFYICFPSGKMSPHHCCFTHYIFGYYLFLLLINPLLPNDRKIRRMARKLCTIQSQHLWLVKYGRVASLTSITDTHWNKKPTRSLAFLSQRKNYASRFGSVFSNTKSDHRNTWEMSSWTHIRSYWVIFSFEISGRHTWWLTLVFTRTVPVTALGKNAEPHRQSHCTIRISTALGSELPPCRTENSCCLSTLIFFLWLRIWHREITGAL